MVTASTLASEDIENRRELARLFFRQARPAIAAQMVMGVITTYLVWSHLGTPYALGWFAVLGAVSFTRLGMIRAHHRRVQALDGPDLSRLELHHALMAGLSGLCWGCVPWVAYQGLVPVLDHLTAAMVFGMAGSATATLAALPRAFPFFVWPAVLPFSIKAALIGNKIYITAAITTIFGIVALMSFNRAVHRIMTESIRLRRENTQLVDKLLKEKQAVEEASRIKSLFLAGVSHDLKHPLNALGLYLGYLKTQQSPENTGVARALPGMEQALGGMGGLLSRLLELSRLEAGEYQLRHDRVALQTLFQRCAAQFADEARKRNLTLRFVPTRATLMADPTLLQSILDNLVSNAVRYTEHGGIVVGVRHRDGRLVIQVADSGPGIPEERVPLLFEAYRRFDDTRRGTEGYGLGLALVKKQCELAGYAIQVRSTPGRGSLFSVRLG